jgi:hypothetical protein
VIQVSDFPLLVSNITILDDFTTPQRCFPGFLCAETAVRPQGQQPCPPGFYCPGTGVFPCPAGLCLHLFPVDACCGSQTSCCAGYQCPSGRTAPIACDDGYYQDQMAQPDCIECPLGTMCPGQNRTFPQICPAGSVCDIIARPVPTGLCTAGYVGDLVPVCLYSSNLCGLVCTAWQARSRTTDGPTLRSSRCRVRLARSAWPVCDSSCTSLATSPRLSRVLRAFYSPHS